MHVSTGLAVSAQKADKLFLANSPIAIAFYRCTDLHATYKLAPGGNSQL